MGWAMGLLWLAGAGLSACHDDKVDFNTEVRPILNKHCVSCHGGVKQSGGFGLVFRDMALGKTKNGKTGIVPGHPDQSELIARITHKDPAMRMPLDGQPLAVQDIKTLTRWIRQGAEWDDHWAYKPPQTPPLPPDRSNWARNEIDRFVGAKMKEKGLQPAPEADRQDLVRRLFLDVTGLPPSPQQVAQFVNDPRATAYEWLVDSLLASPHFGEHWASMWLDLARYADSKGYEKDSRRDIWRYRDWVIRAFNDDMPFDQFTIEQLAGDLLPNPTTDQLVATAFHRNTLNNGEGGTDNEEYRIASVIDRVNTTWETWQSTTMNCVQCHSHPYDPIRQEEYYASFAFFNNTADWDVPSDQPLLKDLNETDQGTLEEIKAWIDAQAATPGAAAKWEKFIRVGEPKLRPEDFAETEKAIHHNRGDQDYMQVFDGAVLKISRVPLGHADRIYVNYRQGTEATATLRIHTDSPDGPVIGSARLHKTGWFTNLAIPLADPPLMADLYIRIESESDDYSCFIDGFLPGEKLPGRDQAEQDVIYEKIDRLINAPATGTTPIMVEKPDSHSRTTRVFVRGNWQVKGDRATPGIPAMFVTDERAFTNRLDLARWLVSDQNPLTARVMVNRVWARIFGKGIVETVEDFGALGDPPSHPELLDWLAVDFSVSNQWHIKALVKKMVMSATYRQSSVASPKSNETDPYNRYLSHSTRVRLSAEQIRDQVLAVSGLLNTNMYGPSVMPLQPEGIWNVVYSDEKWETSEGGDAYRRAVYTYLRRSSPYPSFLSFDASSREFCLSRRLNTNTPLQALVTLNDPVYLEAARQLAQKATAMDGTWQQKIETAYLQVLGKKPVPDKTAVLLSLWQQTHDYYAGHREEARKLTQSEDAGQAAMTVVFNALMNLDEFLVKN